MNSARKQRREVARWEASTRAWATSRGKDLALELYQQSDVAVTPYSVGLVLEQGEKPWVQVPAYCSLDGSRTGLVRATEERRPTSPATSRRLARHQPSDRRTLQPRSAALVAMGRDRRLPRRLDPGPRGRPDRPQRKVPILWTGPGVGPLAVAVVYHLYGPAAMLDHPGLAVLREPGGHI